MSQNEIHGDYSAAYDVIFYKSIMDNFPMAIMTLDPAFCIIDFNTKAEQITGYSKKTVVGRCCEDVLHTPLCRCRCPLMEALNLKKPILDLETTIMNRAGGIIPVRVSIDGLFSRSGKSIGWINAFQDISRSKTLEQKRREMFSMIAHDLKSPLICIEAFAHRLLGKLNNNQEKAKIYTEIIRSESIKLTSLLDSLLKSNMLQNGKIAFDFKMISLSKTLKRLQATYEATAREKGVKLKFHVEKSQSRIEADPRQLSRVFMNLLDNALKFSIPEGAINVETIELETDIIVKVSDEGPGISSEDIPFLFEPFLRGRNQLRISEGFGLGLASAKAIVEGHGGSIRVVSMLGRGSTFSVILPKRQY